jgi:FPC/CPF motif-containing protein YcgG
MQSYDVKDGRLLALSTERPDPEPIAVLVHSQWRGMVLSPAFPCLGGAGAVRREEYRFGMYGDLGDAGTASVCAADLAEFSGRFPIGRNSVAAFVAAFGGPYVKNELEFEHAMWEQLRALSELDPRRAEYPGGLPIDPQSDEVGFLFGGRNYFVVGFHPSSSRWARRFAWPILVFNSLSHQDPLRAAGTFQRMHERIMARDEDLQGCVNRSLSGPQISQFSGRAVGSEWRCPVRFVSGG